MKGKPLAWWFCFSAPHMWTSLVEVFPTSFPNSKTTDHSSVGRGITIAETPKVELSRKPRVDSGGVHYFETANCLLTIVRVIFIFFHHLLLARIILWHCDSLHLCAFQELFLLQNAETGSLHVSRNVAKNRKCCQNKNCSGMPHSRFPFVKKAHVFISENSFFLFCNSWLICNILI